MAELLFGGAPASKRTRIGTVQVDASVREQHANSATVSKHPIESGSNIADHVMVENAVVTLDCIITNTPIVVPETQAGGVKEEQHEFQWSEPVSDLVGADGAIGNVIDLAASVLGVQNVKRAKAKTFGPEFDRVVDCYAEMQRLMSDREPFTLITSLRTYENCLLVNMTPTRTAETGNALEFTATCEQVKIVSTESAEALPDPEELRARPSVPKGPKPPKEADAATGVQSSALLQGLQAAGILQ